MTVASAPRPTLIGVATIASLLLAPSCAQAQKPRSEVVTYASGKSGLLYKPDGAGPFPALLYNHGSAPGRVNDQAFDAIAPGFVARGWVFFAPYRRGQGLSAGPYVMDEIRSARSQGGATAAAETLTRLMSTDHLEDQMAALAWLRTQAYVRPGSIAAMGNSFGGIQAVLGAERGGYCAAVAAAAAAESWKEAPPLRDLLTRAARSADSPLFFFQAENDFDLEPSRALHAARRAADKPSEIRIYPAFGSSASAGHSFPYRGVDIWAPDVMAFLERSCVRKDLPR